MKKGRLTLDEIQFIEANATKISYIEIASQLDRLPKTVKEHIEGMGYHPTIYEDSPASFKNPIEKKNFWPQLQQMFSAQELQVFITHWNDFNAQFNHEVLPTEELQIVDIIKLELMASKLFRMIRDAEKDVDSITLDLREKDKLSPSELSERKDARSNANIAISKMQEQILNIQTRKDALLKALKATRESRIKEVNSDGKTLLHWVESIYGNADTRRALGLEMEKFRLSMIDEEVRLSAYHKYENGEVDQPILNADLVKEDNSL